MAAWLTAIGGVLLAWLAALAVSIAQAIRFCRPHGLIVASCMTRLHDLVVGDAGIAPRITFFALVVSVSAAAVVAGVRLAGTVARMRARAHDHAEAVRLVGHRTGTRDVMVVESAKPAA